MKSSKKIRAITFIAIITIAICTFGFFQFPVHADAQRGRPHLNAARTTFVGDNEQLLRGPFSSTEWSPAESSDKIESIKNLGLNTVHLYAECFDINYPQSGSTAPGYAAAEIDKMVQRTRDLGLYLVITIGNGANNGNFNVQYAKDFWSFYAPRYANEKHVLYEIHNEPVAWGPPYSSSSATPTGAIDMEVASYKIIRQYAPNTPVLLFSYSVPWGNSGASDAMKDIQAFNQAVFGNANTVWNNEAVAIHGYSGADLTSEFAASLINSGTPCFQTEFCADGGKIDAKSTSQLESLKVSWLTFQRFDEVNNPDLYKTVVENAGLSWKPDYGNWPAASTGTGSAPTLYQDSNFGGKAASLGAGNYTMSQLAAAGISNDSVSSIKVPSGFQVEVYADDNFSGSKWTITADNANFSSVGCNDVMSSIKIISSTTTSTGKFHCYLLLGQSNMAGYPKIQSSDTQEDNRVLVLGYDDNSNLGRATDQWDEAAPPLHGGWSGAIGPGDWFGKTMIQNVPNGDSIGLIPCAIPGESIETFLKNGGTKYDWIINRAKLAQQAGGVIEGMIFHQGESNCGDTSWPGKVKTLVNDLRTDLNLGSVPFIAGELSYDSACASHNALVDQLPSVINNCYVVQANGLIVDPNDSYSMHFDHDSVVTLGKRYAQKMIEVLNGQSPTSGGYYKIVSKNSGKVLDVKDQSNADGAVIQQWTDWGGACQQWSLIDAGGGYYKIINRNSGKLLDVDQASTADGAVIHQWSDWGGTNQQWSVVDTGSGYYKIVNRNSSKLLDVDQASTVDGAVIHQWSDWGGANQQWQLVPIGSVIPTTAPNIEPAPNNGGGNCTLVYTIGNDWGSGATISMTIKNNSASTINGWTLVFNFPGNQQITSSWNSTLTQSVQTVTVKNLDWNASIPAGGSLSGDIGFNMNYSGSNAKPTSATLNGSSCTVQ